MPGAQVFTKPTLEEVGAYCDERRNNIDPGAFMDYYDSVGWLIGKKPMKDWRACVRTWERRRQSERSGQFSTLREWSESRDMNEEHGGSS